MEGRLVLKQCALLRPGGRVQHHLAVLIDSSTSRTVAPDADVPVLPGDWAVEWRGRLVGPGLVDAPAHLVGAQLSPSSGEASLHPWRHRFEAQASIESRLTPE